MIDILINGLNAQYEGTISLFKMLPSRHKFLLSVIDDTDTFPINNDRIRGNKMTWTLYIMVYQLSFKEFFMHNLISYNQLSSEDDHEDLLAEYYECLIDCEDNASTCKRICKEVLV